MYLRIASGLFHRQTFIYSALSLNQFRLEFSHQSTYSNNSSKAFKAIRLIPFIGQVHMGLGVIYSGMWLNDAWEFTKEG